jgi:hypothetical protein
MAKVIKFTKRQVSKELEIAANEYRLLRDVLHKQILWNVANRVGKAPEEIEEEFAALT